MPIHIWASLEQVEPALQARLDEFARQPFSELAQLPQWSSLDNEPAGIEITINRKPLPDGRLEIVAQAYRRGRRVLFVQFGEMLARGFWASRGGPVEWMPESALYDYM